VRDDILLSIERPLWSKYSNSMQTIKLPRNLIESAIISWFLQSQKNRKVLLASSLLHSLYGSCRKNEMHSSKVHTLEVQEPLAHECMCLDTQYILNML
jgi:hypothetical protein